MKKNNGGFIAISIIYSFFLLFVVLILMIMYSYISDRKMTNEIKKDITDSLYSTIDVSYEDMKISEATLSSATGGAKNIKSPTFNKTIVSFAVYMPANSTIKYDVDLSNFNSEMYVFRSLTNVSKKSSDISFTSSLSEFDLLKNGDTSFTITLSNDSSESVNTVVSLKLNANKYSSPKISIASLPTESKIGASKTVSPVITAGSTPIVDSSKTCTSVLYSGNITNLNQFTGKGTYTITCSVTDEAGTTVTDKKTVKMYNEYTLTNLAPDPSFESDGSGWSGKSGTISTAQAHSGSKSLYCNDTKTSGTSCWNTFVVDIKAGELAYLRAYVYGVSGSDANNLPYAGAMGLNDDENRMTSVNFNSSTRNQFIMYSKKTTGARDYNKFQMGVSIATTGVVYYDDIMLINLTEEFGAGNEPSLDWCDKNIPYFSGTQTFKVY